jgi:hypothetical protein
LSDNYTTPPTTEEGGVTFASDDIGGVHSPRVKVQFGADGSATDVSSAAPLPVTAASLPLPTGAATSAAQATANASLSAIETAVEGTLAVSAASLPLPSGAATAASQATAIGHLSAIEAAVEGTLTVGTHAVTQSGTWGVRCQDGSGNALTSKVAGSERAMTVAVVDADGNQITSFGGGSGGSGTEYTEDAAAASNPVGGALILVRNDARSGSLVTTDGDNVAARGTNSGELYVKHVDSIPVTDNGATLSIDDGGGVITVDGTVAATQSGTWNVTNVSGTVSLPTGASTAANQSTAIGHLAAIETAIEGTLTVATHAVTQSGSWSVTADTELTTADLDTGGGTDTRAVVGLVGSASGGGQLIPGSSTDGLLVNLGSNNDVTVTGSVTVSGTVTANAGTNLNTSVLALESGGNLAAAATSLGLLDNAVAGNELQVDVVAALPAGTNNIGDVDVLTVPAPLSTTGNGSAATALRVTVANDSTGTIAVGSLPASTNTLEVVGDAAHDAAVAGNPVLIGGFATAGVPTAVSTDGDAARVWTDLNGAQVVKPSVNQIDIQVTPTIDTAVYASGDRLGSVMTFSNAALASGRSGTIVGALLFDDANSVFDIRLHLFKVSPTLANADNGALEFTDANLATAIPIGVIEFDTDNQHTYVNSRIVQGTWLGGPVALPYVTSGSSSIFGVLEARGAYDAAATDDLVVTLTVIRD